ncbi:MAG TPA: bifunctional (p)ppGpp synthetase/guanosine-3',5'-bis(diphosphate) 3'-pyrophosphohydrolase [Dehalococcoidia bacterium]|nr:bifunctional (p)ppGpp synthetase/guanosine-3',5'-bis(diphosphate) 3'-pyrophosphohydrolase [Dehalococcoidia bacterium]
MDIKPLLDKVKEYLPEDKLALVEKAYLFALEAHGNQLRLSGEPFVTHPLETAMIVADLQLDETSLAAALLHDVPEDCGIPFSELEKRFGAEVTRLVEGVTRLDKISAQVQASGLKKIAESEAQVESLRKMFVAMAADIRVVIIKLADRLHNMRTLKALQPEKQLRIAQETMDIYAPLAHRLGIYQLRWELEDLAFRYLQPDKYKEIARLVAARRATRERYIEKVSQILREELDKAGVKAEVTGRPKSLYSVYRKMQRYSAMGKEFSDIHDLLALRVLADTVQDCYSVLGVVHNLWHPLPDQFDDFIANPKENRYQALHSTVMCMGARPLEIQIRTHRMHRIAEYGVAAHWKYKEGAKKDIGFEEKITWLRQLMEWQRELSGSAFMESIKTDIFQDQVFVYTPKGDIKELPRGAAPLDFAYRIHTDLGHRCIGAKVNGRLVSLDYQLRNGDTVEIMTTKSERGPSLDWLNPNLGYVNTHQARERIKQWFRRQEKAENVERGREILEKELRRLGVSFADRERIAQLFKYEIVDDFLAAIGCGDINPNQIALKLTAPEEKPLTQPTTAPPKVKTTSAVKVLGVGDLLTQIAACCQPVPGDEIIGFITRGRGVTIHRKNCTNILNEDEKERLVRVEWGEAGVSFPVNITVEAWDRVGLLRDVSALVSGEDVNIASVSLSNPDRRDGTLSIFLSMDIKNIGQLGRLFGKLEAVPGVINVSRSSDVRREG